jgi:hypothetical protein
MGWVNVQWGIPPNIGPRQSFPPKATDALNYVVECNQITFFPTQLALEGPPKMLALEAPRQFMDKG